MEHMLACTWRFVFFKLVEYQAHQKATCFRWEHVDFGFISGMGVYCRGSSRSCSPAGSTRGFLCRKFSNRELTCMVFGRRRAGEELDNWQSLKAAISIVFGPTYVGEEAHVSLFRTRYNEGLDEYVAEFCRWSLQLPEMNEVTRTMLFIRGLPDCTQREVLRDHPQSLCNFRSSRSASLFQHERKPAPVRFRPLYTTCTPNCRLTSMKQLRSPPVMTRALA